MKEEVLESRIEVLEEQVEHLQEQLNEANEVIKKYVDLGKWNDYYNDHLGEVTDDMQKYLEKWGVK
jgi:hypothetical protein